MKLFIFTYNTTCLNRSFHLPLPDTDHPHGKFQRGFTVGNEKSKMKKKSNCNSKVMAKVTGQKCKKHCNFNSKSIQFYAKEFIANELIASFFKGFKFNRNRKRRFNSE